MSRKTPGPGPNDPQGEPHGQPGWNPPQQPDYEQDAEPGYQPAPAWSAGPASTDRRPGKVTAAGVIGIVWGGLGLLFGLLVLAVAFSADALLGVLTMASAALAAVLLLGGIQVMRGKSPRLLLLISYVAIGINVLSMIFSVAQGESAANGLLGFILPGLIVFLLLNPQTRQYYAARGIGY